MGWGLRGERGCSWYYKQGIPFSTLEKKKCTAKLPLVYLVTQLARKRQPMFWKTNKKLLGNSCFDISCKSCLNISCKSYFDILHILIFVNLQNSKECPPTLSVPSYLLVIKYE